MDNPTITVKLPQLTNHLSSMYHVGNTQLQIGKWWVPLISALYIFYFWSDLCQCLSIITIRCEKVKTHKETVQFLKTIMIHPSTAPLSNAKLKRVLKVYCVLYNYSIWKNTMSKFQYTEEFTRKLCALRYYFHTAT